MLHGARVAVVIPARDEAQWIAETVGSVPAFVDHVIVVDDGSRDGTAGIARAALPAGDARLDVLVHPEPLGVGAAIVAGYRRARALGAAVVAVMAGDGQMDPRDLPRVVAPIASGEADYVKGDRLRHPDVWRVMPLQRLAATAALAALTRRAARLDALSDSQCGYTAISARALDALDLDGLWPRYGYPNDLLAALAARRLRVREVSVRPVYRGEASGLRATHVLTILFLIARAAMRRRLSGSGNTQCRPGQDGTRELNGST
ncbi:glycosyltransferase family 2 protein [Sorangium cellulosum]|uniref:glycosyltransferase family 2 protein n=1 Tax=Sorangium cellulosum TaxID=56 RepID=UPI001010B8DE|nr:glycosyltransferase family 2 protein [Sorangium cellulosum]